MAATEKPSNLAWGRGDSGIMGQDKENGEEHSRSGEQQRLEIKEGMKCAEMCNWVQIEGAEMRLGRYGENTF